VRVAGGPRAVLRPRRRFLDGVFALLKFPLGLVETTGAVAQLVARLVRNEKVRGSSPLSSTSTDLGLPGLTACRSPPIGWIR
jgi:hypothetical protein